MTKEELKFAKRVFGTFKRGTPLLVVFTITKQIPVRSNKLSITVGSLVSLALQVSERDPR